MKITVVRHELNDAEKLIKAHDDLDSVGGIYDVGRGIVEILDDSYLDFNFFKHLRNLCRKTSSRIEVLEGGCGRGNALVNLKGGITYKGKRYKGTGEAIRTTGITLSMIHSNFAKDVEEPHSVDEMIIGPVEHHNFDRQYDFIFDFYGAAFYFPFDALPVYGRLLKLGSLCFVRLEHGPNGYVKKGSYYDPYTLFEESGLSVVRSHGIHYPEDRIDYLAVKR